MSLFYLRRMSSNTLKLLIVLVYALNLASCAPPPDQPPEDLEALLGFIFKHSDDEDPSVLAQGIDQLYTWFEDKEQLESAREGFLIDDLDLSQVSLNGLDSDKLGSSALRGVSVVTKSPHCVKSIVGLLTWSEFGSLLDSFDSYERTFDQESSCMLDRSCLQVTAQSETSSRWVGLVGITTKYQIEFRWVFTTAGWALVHRFWLKEPAIGDRFGVKMNANFYVGITIADQGRSFSPPSPSLISSSNGIFGGSGDEIEALQQTLSQPGALRIHANWFDVDTGDFPFDDAMIANLLVQQQKNDSEQHDVMIDENATPGTCQQADTAEMMDDIAEDDRNEINE